MELTHATDCDATVSFFLADVPAEELQEYLAELESYLANRAK